MNTDLEVIENYVTGQLSPEERARFEADLRTDPAVADALAFYMLTKQVARNERRAELDALRKSGLRTQLPWHASMRWVAAASVVLMIGLGWYLFQRVDSASQRVDSYVSSHFMHLQTTMDGSPSGSSLTDSLRAGIDQFNKEKLSEADALFRAILTRYPGNDSALKFSGIVAFRQGNYDEAISLFHRLSQRTDLYSNSGLFYESIALLKRGQPLDKEHAKKLIEEVIRRNLDGKQEAEKLLNELH